MTKTVVKLASPYKSYKMLTNLGKIQFVDGVARVEFDNEAKAKEFIDNIKANQALTPYVRVVSDAQAETVAKLHMNTAQLGGVKTGPQTSEMPKIMPQGVVTNPTPAEVFSGEAKGDEAKGDAADGEPKEEPKKEA